MNRLLWIVLLVLISRCDDAETIAWQAREYSGPECAECPSVQVSIPEGPENNRLAESVKRAQQEEIIQWLDYDENSEAADIDEAIAAFGAGYREILESFPDEVVGWEAEIESLVLYESASLLTLSIDGYIFTGGAHGYSSKRLLSFDKVRASELDPEDLLGNRKGFEEIAEQAFRETYQIGSDQDINSTGFMFTDNRFVLPENIGFTPEGVLLHYNPYEVASYADGPLEVVIPFEDAAPFLAPAYRPGTDQ